MENLTAENTINWELVSWLHGGESDGCFILIYEPGNGLGQHQLFTFPHKEWWKASGSRRSNIFFVCLS